MCPCLQPAGRTAMLKTCRSSRPFMAARCVAPPRAVPSSPEAADVSIRTRRTCRQPVSRGQCGQDQGCCSLDLDKLALSRRETLMAAASTVIAIAAMVHVPQAMAGGIGRYIKRKALDPLDTYVPLVLEARQQLQRVGGVMGESPASARDLLRSGPFSGLRDNIRAIGEYAAAAAATGAAGGSSADAGALVLGFFKELEGLDRVLYEAVRDKKPIAQDDAADKLKATISALDSLVATVPADVLDRSQQIVQRIQGAGSSQPGAAPSSADVEQLQQLMSGST